LKIKTDINRTEAVPGAFAEYTNTQLLNLIFVAGLWADYNSRFGWLVTLRLNIKYDVNEFIIVRAPAGQGFRSPDVLAERDYFLIKER
jgi:outer membrane receptor protein involved in Fe transport